MKSIQEFSDTAVPYRLESLTQSLFLGEGSLMAKWFGVEMRAGTPEACKRRTHARVAWNFMAFPLLESLRFRKRKCLLSRGQVHV